MTNLSDSAEHEPERDRLFAALRNWAVETKDEFITLGRSGD
jgi:hypothetical protein